MNRVDRVAAGILYFRFGYGTLNPSDEDLQRAWDRCTSSMKKDARSVAKKVLAPMLKQIKVLKMLQVNIPKQKK